MQNETYKDHIEATMRQYTRNPNTKTRDAVVCACQPLARFFAKRYNFSNREMYEDLLQMANLGLLRAITDFTPAKNIRFLTYATPKMLGEVRRYLRDKGNHIRIPRRLYEAYPQVQAVQCQLRIQLGYEPTTDQIADALNTSEKLVSEVIQMWYYLEAPSLDASVGPDTVRADLVGSDDFALLGVVAHADIQDALAQLDPTEHEVIVNRFLHEKSQGQIAKQMQISQMQVSRLERRALSQLKLILRENLSDQTSENTS